MLKQGIYHMELYFIMKTILWKTVLLARQTYINLIMKCQQLQMKLLNSWNSNSTKFLVSYLQKVFGHSKIWASASASALQTFSLCLLKFYFKK